MRQQGRTAMNQRGDSPQRNDLNNHVMAQLNSQINNIDINDLPPPPPVPQVIKNLLPSSLNTQRLLEIFTLNPFYYYYFLVSNVTAT